MSGHALFVGRWQPFHDGHLWLINQGTRKGEVPLVLVRDIPPDEDNPLTTAQTIEIIKAVLPDATVMAIPDISSVNYGRGVGYRVDEHKPPTEIGGISATYIRDQISRGEIEWKSHVPTVAVDLIEKYLS